MPYPIKSEKPTLDPGIFEVPAAPYDDLAILHVGISKYRPYFGENFPAILVPELGQTIANSIVYDYINALPAITGEAYPGLFVLRNKMHIDQVKKNYADKVQEARDAQEQWFWRLILMADDIFPHQGHKSIMRFQREAAKAMGYKADWNIMDHRIIDRLIAEGKVKPATVEAR